MAPSAPAPVQAPAPRVERDERELLESVLAEHRLTRQAQPAAIVWPLPVSVGASWPATDRAAIADLEPECSRDCLTYEEHFTRCAVRR